VLLADSLIDAQSIPLGSTPRNEDLTFRASMPKLDESLQEEDSGHSPTPRGKDSFRSNCEPVQRSPGQRTSVTLQVAGTQA